MMIKHLYACLAACLASALLFVTFAVAGPAGGPGGSSGGPGRPGAIPGGGMHDRDNDASRSPNTTPNVLPSAVPSPFRNPNGTPPFGKATGAPDTDRGNSEGKGHTDTHNMIGMQTFTGTVTSFTGTTLVLTLPSGTTRTFTVNAHAYGQMLPKVGQTVSVRTNGTATVLNLKIHPK